MKAFPGVRTCDVRGRYGVASTVPQRSAKTAVDQETIAAAADDQETITAAFDVHTSNPTGNTPGRMCPNDRFEGE
jgi:aspartate aminotransferase-like enzyme